MFDKIGYKRIDYPMKQSRRKILFFIVALFIISMYYVALSVKTSPTFYSQSVQPITNLSDLEISTINQENSSASENVYNDFIVYTRKCRIRNYNYSEQSILEKYFNDEVPKCPNKSKPFIFYPVLDLENDRSCIGFDNVTTVAIYPDFNKWNCSYSQVIRKENNSDKEVDFINEKPIQIGKCPNEEFLWIKCRLPTDGEIYEQPLMLPFVKPGVRPVIPNNQKKKPMNVLVLGMDSVSRLNAHRQFRKTLGFLLAKKNIIELFGYNKIGMNSQPNQIPLLTGIQFDPPPGLIERSEDAYFDNLTIYVWEEYERRGYRTMFYEDFTPYGLFVYGSLKGFEKEPTTYYPRAIMRQIDKSELKTKIGEDRCIGNHFPAKHYLDYTFNTMKLLGPDRPLFSYSWLVEAAHDDIVGAQSVDGYVYEFFKQMEDDNILNNTAVFFISDHGFRFGSFRETKLGEHEDNLPFGFVLLPDWYYEQNPNDLKNIQANSRQLVTVYDLHATLRELADIWSEGRTMKTAYGYSLLSNVIPDRNCREAHIGFQFCACYEQNDLGNYSDISKSLATSVIDEINSIVAHNNASKTCHSWSLDSVENFVRLSEGERLTDLYKISITTKPEARFDASAELNESKWKFLSKIDRIDWFSSKAECVKESEYERYCYCKNFTSPNQ